MSGLNLLWTILVPLNATTANTARDRRGNYIPTSKKKPVGDTVLFLVGQQTVFPKERYSNALFFT